MTKQTIKDIDLKGKRVLVRVDYNVPVADGKVGDTLRIQASFDTIHYLLAQDCSIVLMSHLGRPEGKVDPALSLRPVATKASELLGHPIGFVSDCVGPEVQAAVTALHPGQVLLLENLRFHAGEEANDTEFAHELSHHGEVYVDDAFAAIHRAHASTVGVTKYLPSVEGLLVEKEVQTIVGALEHPDRPLVAVIGGAKVSTKLDVLDNLLHKVDALYIGGAMANTFLAGRQQTMGKSIYEPDLVEKTKEITKLAAERGVELVLPANLIISESPKEAKNLRTVPPAHVEAGDYIVDLGPEFGASVGEHLAGGGTVIWNGPLGLFEVPEFAKGSLALANAIIKSGVTSIIGGGDTAALVDEAGLHDKFSWVSTGGGAALELMAGKALPGLEALRDK